LKTKTDFVFYRLTWGILFLLAFTRVFIPINAVTAHPIDMYAQDQAVQISQDGLQVDWKITPGPMLAGQLWDSADSNQDGRISGSEEQAWVVPVLSQWEARLDGSPLDSFTLKDIHWPATIDDLQGGTQPIEILLTFQWPAGLSGQHLLEFHNIFQEVISQNSFSLKSDPGINFSLPQQNNSQLSTQVDFSSPSAGSSNQAGAGLTTWESGRPQVPGLTAAVSNLAANLASPGTSSAPSTNSASPISALTSLMKTQDFSPLFLAGAFLLSLALGSLHALTPGHSKTLVAAYLVGTHGKIWDAVFLGSVVTITHTGSVLLLGLITLVASRYILPALILPWLEIVSGVFVILFGLNLFIRRGKTLVSWIKTRTNPARHRLTSIKSVQAHDHPTAFMAHSPASHALIPHRHPGDPPGAGFPHEHGHHSHGHSHELPPEGVTWRSLLGLGISGGLVPCPDAIAILLVAVAINRIPFGMLLIIAFSLGLALVLIAIGMAMVQGLRLLQHNDLINRFSIYSPIASAVVVVALGIGLTLSAFNSVSISSGTIPSSGSSAKLADVIQVVPTDHALIQPTPLPFDLQQAKIIYTALDQKKASQLFSSPVSGGSPVQYTQEGAGVSGFSISPDGQTILYATMQTDGGTAIWSINRDGTNQHVILDCPTAHCAGPVWSPDGQKIIYERSEYNQSLWWLDVKSGETKSVFSDPSFPGYGPAFSRDGRWLSYNSPTKNAIEGFSLVDGQSFSIHNLSGIPAQWSPVDDSLLYWDLVSSTPQSILSMKRYDPATGKIIDLSGTDGSQDYPAAWSPDGQWIAVVKDTLNADLSATSSQIWLVKPDGSQAHVLVNEDGMSYTHIGWTPDSQKLVYSRFANNDVWSESIWLANAATGQETKLISSGSMPEIIP
jgi:nickel/cobalt exporter